MAPELSVVILSYSQFDQTTGPCLDSLREVDTADLEIIVVDNDSDEVTLNRLAAAASEDHRIRLVLNKENRGFAGGNNDGVAHARAGTIVLLNSDTRVLPNSLSLLANQLDFCVHAATKIPVRKLQYPLKPSALVEIQKALWEDLLIQDAY